MVYGGAQIFTNKMSQGKYILTIRNMKCIPLGECVFNVHGLQFDNLCQVEYISILCHANLPENIYMLSIKKKNIEKPNN